MSRIARLAALAAFVLVSNVATVLVLGGRQTNATGPINPMCGDVNQDGQVDISDPVQLLGYLFAGGSMACAQTPALTSEEITELKELLQFVDAVSTPYRREVRFTGCNVEIRNGLGSTDGTGTSDGHSGAGGKNFVVNGLGNLIVGYNHGPELGPEVTTTGSHNILIGEGNSYTTYGCIVAGWGGSSGQSKPYEHLIGCNDMYVSSVSGGKINLWGELCISDPDPTCP